MRLCTLLFLTLWMTVPCFAMVEETGTLRGFVLGDEPSCAYDNWVSHISEGVTRPGLNDYGPSWFDPQTNGFGGYAIIPADSAGDLTMQAWRDVFTAGINEQWTTIDSILVSRDSTWRYELVELLDTELNKTFYLLRERLDSSFVDVNVDSISTDDVVGSFQNGWGLFVFNPTALFSKLTIEVPHAEDDFLALPVGLEMFIRTDARALMIAGAGREVAWDTSFSYYNNDRSLSDPSRNCRSPFAEYHRTLYDMLNAGPTSPMVTVQVHSYDHFLRPALNDVHLSAFSTDRSPNPPIRDLAEHKDVFHFMGETPVMGLPGCPEINRRIDGYASIFGNNPYFYYGVSDTLLIPNPDDAGGATRNCEGVYSHSSHDVDVDPENFIHTELDEYPDGLWMPEQWHDWLPGSAPATLQTFQLAISYFSPLIAALDSALRYTYVYPDTIPPVNVQFDQVVPLATDSVYLHWTPPAVDRFFDTYIVYYDTTGIGDSTANHTRHDPGYLSLNNYSTSSIIVSGLVPPLDLYRFAIASQDIWGNRAVRSPSQGQTPGPFVLTRSVLINDTVGGDSNGYADFGETIGITLTEMNLGSETARGVVVNMSCVDPFLTVTDSLEAYGEIIPQQQIAISDGFRAMVSVNVPDSHSVPLAVMITDSALHAWPNTFNILTHAPTLQVAEVIVNDSTGNGNGVMDAGETVGLRIFLRNAGSAHADTIQGILTSDYAHISITQPTGQLPLINPGQSVTLTPYTAVLSPSAPAEDHVFFYLGLTTTNGRVANVIFELPVGGFSDLIETGPGAWTHQSNQQGWLDRWHISTEMSHSPTHAWKCGSSGTGNYSNHMDAVLNTPVITLVGHQELRFWQWMQAQDSPTYPDSCYDGGIVELAANGGAWQQLTPTGGYNKWIRCINANGTRTSGPFTPRTHCFSGTIAWREVVCDLGAYSGPVQIRFRFGSDSTTTREGWYVDNVRIVRANSNNAPQNLQAELQGPFAHLTWQSPPSLARSGELRGYNIYRNNERLASVVTILSYDDDLSGQPDASFIYAVSAQYSDSESSLSNPVTVTWLAAPNPVTDLVVVCDSLGVFLTWTPTNADLYYVLVSSDPTDFSHATMTEVTAPPFSITDDVSQHIKRFYVVLSVR